MGILWLSVRRLHVRTLNANILIQAFYLARVEYPVLMPMKRAGFLAWYSGEVKFKPVGQGADHDCINGNRDSWRSQSSGEKANGGMEKDYEQWDLERQLTLELPARRPLPIAICLEWPHVDQPEPLSPLVDFQVAGPSLPTRYFYIVYISALEVALCRKPMLWLRKIVCIKINEPWSQQ